MLEVPVICFGMIYPVSEVVSRYNSGCRPDKNCRKSYFCKKISDSDISAVLSLMFQFAPHLFMIGCNCSTLAEIGAFS